MQVHVLHTFACVSAASAASLADESIHEGIHKGWRPPKAAATLCGGGAKRRPLHGWIRGGQGGSRRSKGRQWGVNGASMGVNGASMGCKWASMGRQWGVNGASMGVNGEEKFTP